MEQSIGDIPKKRGRKKTTGRGEGALVRLHPPLLAALDAFVSAQPDPKPSRPEAIRQGLIAWLSELDFLEPQGRSRAANILAGARAAPAIARGEADPDTYKVHSPADIDVRATRAATGMTQAAFAAAFGLPVAFVRDWEKGAAKPDQAARSYLLLIQRAPDLVRQALARPLDDKV